MLCMVSIHFHSKITQFLCVVGTYWSSCIFTNAKTRQVSFAGILDRDRIHYAAANDNTWQVRMALYVELLHAGPQDDINACRDGVGAKELAFVDALKGVITFLIVWIVVHKMSKRLHIRHTNIIKHSATIFNDDMATTAPVIKTLLVAKSSILLFFLKLLLTVVWQKLCLLDTF